MSLERYSNNDTIFDGNESKYGVSIGRDDLDDITSKLMSPKIFVSGWEVITETHLYTMNSDYLGFSFDFLEFRSTPDYFLPINVKKVFDKANIERGSFKVVINLLLPLFGNSIVDRAKVVEISNDRTEVQLKIDSKDRGKFQEFLQYVNDLKSYGELNNLVVNFSDNRIYKLLNFRTDRYDEDVFYIKIYGELEDSIEEKESAWFGVEMADSYVDTIILTDEVEKPKPVEIGGPNFRMDVDGWNSNSTSYKTWDDLLDADIETNSVLLDKLFSGSAQATLNIDYTDFDNFIFYSSAKDRLSNFREKIKVIEGYEEQISNLNDLSSSNAPSTKISIDRNLSRIDKIKKNFDDFERWVYYAPEDNIFTHDQSGSITPWPKFESGSNLYPYSYSSSQADQWYEDLYKIAVDYDRTNVNSLYWSIPEHVLMDSNNSNYITMVNMTGQHFDVMHSYIKALNKVHEKDEHPSRGISNDILYHIAKSFGWSLQNTRANSNLWKYFLGLDQTGSKVESMGVEVESHELQTQQIWRRTLLNLPYLLKTKGTNRSLKALMSIYGIPSTVLSIKEYGGATDTEKPTFIEDRFTYKLITDSGSYVTTDVDQNIKSVIFRVSSLNSGSANPMPVFGVHNGTEYDWKLNLNMESSVSGSDKYGSFSVSSSYSDPIPLFDGDGKDMWTVMIEESGSDMKVSYGKAPDSLKGRVVFGDSFTFTPSQSFSELSGSEFRLGSIPAESGEEPFEGYVQSFKTLNKNISNEIFTEYIKNPNAYFTDNYSSSYDDVVQYFPLGATQQRENRFLETAESSSHPNQSLTPSMLSYHNFSSGSQSDHYRFLYETYYVRVPRIGPNIPFSQKIRVEDVKLEGDLNPSFQVTSGEYDDKPIDTNRLAVVFSLADQINRDIYNHVGFENIDQYIGNIEEMYGEDYTYLRYVRSQYFKKYEQINNINDFINILSLYDYTFFEQIKQLTPSRADLIDGILIEPHILERSKVRIYNQLGVSEHGQTANLGYLYPSQSGDENSHDSEVEIPICTSVEYSFRTGGFCDPIEIDFDQGEIREVCHEIEAEISSSIWSEYNGRMCVIDVLDEYSGSEGEVCLSVTKSRVNPCYKLKKFIYKSLLFEDNIYTNSYFTDVYFHPTHSVIMPEHWDSYDSLGNSVDDISSFDYYIAGIESPKERLDRGWVLNSSSGNRMFTTQSFNYFETGSFLLRVYARPSPIGSRGYLNLTVNDRNDIDNIPVTIGTGSRGQYPNEYLFEFDVNSSESNPSGSFPEHYIELSCDTGSVVVYSVELFEYRSKYDLGMQKVKNMEEGRDIGNTLHEVDYQIKHCESRNRSRYVGSKLRGAGINIDSEHTIDKGPVIEVTRVNPNSLRYGDSSRGDLTVE